MKKAVSFLLVLCMILSVGAFSLAASNEQFAGGDGTKENPYKVENAQQLSAIRNYMGSYFIQTADIDLGGGSWVPIGEDNDEEDSQDYFKGEFNGNGFTIKELTINKTVKEKDNHYYGLFGVVSGLIKNVNLENVSISIQAPYNKNDDSYPFVNVGAVAGLAMDKEIVNCTASGTITVQPIVDGYIGGIVGMGNGAVSSTSKVNITVTGKDTEKTSGSVACGGIMGQPYSYNSKIEKCVNYGNIELVAENFCYCGGITGNYGYMDYCVNYGSIKGTSIIHRSYRTDSSCTNVGGISGFSHTVHNSINYGNITGKSLNADWGTPFVGGILGCAEYYNYQKISDCYNLGKTINGSIPEGDVYLGRIVGYENYAGYEKYIDNCYSINSTLLNGKTPTEAISRYEFNGESLDESTIKDKSQYILDQIGNSIDTERIKVQYESSYPFANNKFTDLFIDKIAIVFDVDPMVEVTHATGKLLIKEYDTDNEYISCNITDENIISGSRSLVIENNKYLKPNTKYYIEITGKVSFKDGTEFTGLSKSDEWFFTTVPIQYPKIINGEVPTPIDLNSYQAVMGINAYASIMRASDASKDGICYGMAYTVGAWNSEYPVVRSITDGNEYLMDCVLSSKGTSNLSLQQYYELAFAYQKSFDVAFNRNYKNKVKHGGNLEKIYEAITDAISGESDPIVLEVSLQPGNTHALYPIGIVSDTTDELTIAVYDCNCPYQTGIGVPAGEGIRTFIKTMTFEKNAGKLISWEYKEYNSEGKESYITYSHISKDGLDNHIRTGFGVTPGFLIYAYNMNQYPEDSLIPINPAYSATDYSNKDLYWTKNKELSVELEKDGEIGFVTENSLISVSVSDPATIFINIDEEIVKIDSTTEKNDYEVTYSDPNDSISEETVRGETGKRTQITQNQTGYTIESDASHLPEVISNKKYSKQEKEDGVTVFVITDESKDSPDASKPGETDTPSESPKPSESIKPSESPKPSESVKPSESPKPVDPVIPGDHSNSCPSKHLTDMKNTEGKWFHEGVDYAISNGYMTGVEDNLFAPNRAVSRAMVAQILYAAEGKPAVTKPAGFSDIKAGKWYTDAVNWAAGKGVVAGYPDGSFKPDKAVTREELATILHKYAQTKTDAFGIAMDALEKFQDKNQIHAYAVNAMEWAVTNRIISGTDKGLEPRGTATRAQLAVMLQAFDKAIEK